MTQRDEPGFLAGLEEAPRVGCGLVLAIALVNIDHYIMSASTSA